MLNEEGEGTCQEESDQEETDRETLESIMWELPLPRDIPEVACMICTDNNLRAFIDQTMMNQMERRRRRDEDEDDEEEEEEWEESEEEDEEAEDGEREEERMHETLRIVLTITGEALVRAYETKGDFDAICWALVAAYENGTYRVRSKTFSDEELATLKWMRIDLEEDARTRWETHGSSTVPSDFAGGYRR